MFTYHLCMEIYIWSHSRDCVLVNMYCGCNANKMFTANKRNKKMSSGPSSSQSHIQKAKGKRSSVAASDVKEPKCQKVNKLANDSKVVIDSVNPSTVTTKNDKPIVTYMMHNFEEAKEQNFMPQIFSSLSQPLRKKGQCDGSQSLCNWQPPFKACKSPVHIENSHDVNKSMFIDGKGTAFDVKSSSTEHVNQFQTKKISATGTNAENENVFNQGIGTSANNGSVYNSLNVQDVNASMKDEQHLMKADPQQNDIDKHDLSQTKDGGVQCNCDHYKSKDLENSTEVTDMLVKSLSINIHQNSNELLTSSVDPGIVKNSPENLNDCLKHESYILLASSMDMHENSRNCNETDLSSPINEVTLSPNNLLQAVPPTLPTTKICRNNIITTNGSDSSHTSTIIKCNSSSIESSSFTLLKTTAEGKQIPEYLRSNNSIQFMEENDDALKNRLSDSNSITELNICVNEISEAKGSQNMNKENCKAQFYIKEQRGKDDNCKVGDVKPPVDQTVPGSSLQTEHYLKGTRGNGSFQSSVLHDDKSNKRSNMPDMDDDFDISNSQLASIEDECRQWPTLDEKESESVSIPIILSSACSEVTVTNVPEVTLVQQMQKSRQRLRSVIQEISRLNAMLTRVRREVWSSSRVPN